MTTRTWKTNAADFALLDKGEGWPFAALVACSVKPGLGNGGDRKTDQRNDRYADRTGKVSISTFAREAGTSAPRIKRYYDAWERAHEEGWVANPDQLLPEDALSVELPDKPWKMSETNAEGERGVYDTSNTGGPSSISQVVAKAQVDPVYASKIRSAIDELPEEPETKRERFVALAQDDDVREHPKTVLKAAKSLDKAPTNQERAVKTAAQAERSESALPKAFAIATLANTLVSVRRSLIEAGEMRRSIGDNLTGEDQETIDMQLRDIAELATGMVGQVDDWDTALESLIGGDL